MGIDKSDLQGIMVGSEAERVKALCQLLGYPLHERDPNSKRFWFLRPGNNIDEARDTAPIAIAFYRELVGSDAEIKQFLTSKEQHQVIYKHYIEATEPPVMYILLPVGDGKRERVALILPTEGRIRQRCIQTFGWQDEDLRARLARLQQAVLADKIWESVIGFVPQVDYIFYEPANTAKELAGLLAQVTRKIEQAIPLVYEQELAGGYLHNLLDSFRRELLPNLKVSGETEKDYSFADIYAQTIAYGFFTARVFSFVKEPRSNFDRERVWENLPETNPFLRLLFQDISERKPEQIGDDLIDAILEIVSILRAAKMDAILEDFRNNMNREDIVIRFYEDFLAAYKPQMRDCRGVYYTPEPVVSYMVRSVDELIKDKFNKPLGIADPSVMILDPACGTGTFLLWIFKLIYQRFRENPGALTVGLKDKSWNGYVAKCLLPRIFGFELLMAPYAICHLKLGLFLEETGYQFNTGERLGVYLMNTLDDLKLKTDEQQLSLNLPQMEQLIAKEAGAGYKVKKTEPIMVVIGNPPYSGHSENNSPWIKDLVNNYYFIDGQPLGEKNPKWLQDDYVKFMRFSQWRIDESGQGILAFINNHGFLDNPTFRGMRQQLIKSFDEIFVYDLHGNSKKKETALDGGKDENVFDIQQGVSVNIMVKLEK